MARYYRIVNKDTGMVLFDIFWSGIGGYEARWEEPTSNFYKEIDDINYTIEQAIEYGATSILDNCEIVTFEKKYTVVKGSIKLENVRSRIEQKAVVNKLKYG
jgi:hypothetical protein